METNNQPITFCTGCKAKKVVAGVLFLLGKPVIGYDRVTYHMLCCSFPTTPVVKLLYVSGSSFQIGSSMSMTIGAWNFLPPLCGQLVAIIAALTIHVSFLPCLPSYST